MSVRDNAAGWLHRERTAGFLLLALGVATWPLALFAVHILHMPRTAGKGLFVPWAVLLPAGLATLLASWLHSRVPRLLRFACHAAAILLACAAILFTAFAWWGVYMFGWTWVP